MSRHFVPSTLLLVFLLPLVPGPVSAARADTLEVFVAKGCPHCAAAEAYLEELEARRPELVVVVRDVSRDPGAMERLRSLSRALDVGGVAVPTFHAGGRVAVGFSDAEGSGPRVEALLRRAEGGPDAPNGIAPVPTPIDGATPVAGGGGSADVVLPLVGSVSLDAVGLPAFTVALGLLDGFNPCAMWVLLFILSILVNVRSRRRMILIGGTFVLVSGVAYFAFMAAWLNVFLLVGFSRAVQGLLGGAGLVLGGLNVKDFFFLGRGPSLGIPEAARPGIYARVRRVLTAQNLPAALGGVVVLAALVNTVELLCTAGLPALYTQILSLRGPGGWQHYGYLALYNAAYMLDDAAVLTVAVVTLSRHRLQGGEARWLKLLSGVVMMALGTVLLLRPGWLTP